MKYTAEGYDKLYVKQEKLFKVLSNSMVSIAEMMETSEYLEFDKARKEASAYYKAWIHPEEK